MIKKEFSIVVRQQYKKSYNYCIQYDQLGNREKVLVESREKDYAKTNFEIAEGIKFALDKLMKESKLDGDIMNISINPHENIDGYKVSIRFEEMSE